MKEKEIILPTLNLKELEKIAIIKALYQAKGNTKETASILGVSVRKVQYVLKSWGKTSKDFQNVPVQYPLYLNENQ